MQFKVGHRSTGPLSKKAAQRPKKGSSVGPIAQQGASDCASSLLTTVASPASHSVVLYLTRKKGAAPLDELEVCLDASRAHEAHRNARGASAPRAPHLSARFNPL